ncbi:MAG: hypothetical protein KI785_05135 [Devosiaceae bacterium]|nr:hypothetical protein [Devosiaceae bacterium MH13]
MALLLAFTDQFLDDLSERPGKTKLDKQKAGMARRVVERDLDTLFGALARQPFNGRLPADVFDEPEHVRIDYVPTALAELLVKFDRLAAVPDDSAYEDDHPEAYVVAFRYQHAKLALLAAYWEQDGQPILAFHRAAGVRAVRSQLAVIGADAEGFDAFFAEVSAAIVA